MPLSSFNRFELELTAEQAGDCSHQGRCDDDVDYWAPRISRPKECTPENLRDELQGYGAWSDDELADDTENWKRIIWIAAGNIQDEEIEPCKQ